MWEDDEEVEIEDDEVQTVDSVVKAAVIRMAAMVDKTDFKMTMGDFIRLVEFRKQLSNEGATHVTVTWVDPLESTDFESDE